MLHSVVNQRSWSRLRAAPAAAWKRDLGEIEHLRWRGRGRPISSRSPTSDARKCYMYEPSKGRPAMASSARKGACARAQTRAHTGSRCPSKAPPIYCTCIPQFVDLDALQRETPTLIGGVNYNPPMKQALHRRARERGAFSNDRASTSPGRRNNRRMLIAAACRYRTLAIINLEKPRDGRDKNRSRACAASARPTLRPRLRRRGRLEGYWERSMQPSGHSRRTIILREAAHRHRHRWHDNALTGHGLAE